MHTIRFTDYENLWRDALPFGNGVMGGMTYLEGGELISAFTHYEVYYSRYGRYANEKHDPQYPKYAEMVRLANIRQSDANREAMYTYNMNTDALETMYGRDFTGESHPLTGSLRLKFSDESDTFTKNLTLRIEDASIDYTLNGCTKSAKTMARQLRKDLYAWDLSQTEAGIIKELKIDLAPCRAGETQCVRFSQKDEHTFVYESEVYPFGENRNLYRPVSFTGIVRAVGAVLERIEITDGIARLRIAGDWRNATILFGVFTTWKYSNPLNDGIKLMGEWERGLEGLTAEHEEYWRGYFETANISLPDEFLETAWYANLYALGACSGNGGVMEHQACGLNGMWDVKRPTIWGSLWYWDVNIQSAFSPVFALDRLDLGAEFARGLLSYLPDAEKFARNIYGFSGVAIDYPHPMYNCIWPWSALFLWAQYEYSRDIDFLRDSAYPLFMKLCEFIKNVVKKDGDNYYFYPDISPEQGPLARNTVITLASVKALIKATLKAAEILCDNNNLLDECRIILTCLPDYTVTTSGHFKDSESAYDEMFLRHPSILMPIFPAGEIDARSDAKTLEIAKNTIKYVEHNSELGIFGFGWISASAARLGMGQTSIRTLYELGINLSMRKNGLCAEETDRFVNFCSVSQPPLYYPCMVEATGGILNAVCEMLLDSHDGIIRVFPALPDGDCESWRYVGRYTFELKDKFPEYDAWHNLRFDGLLSKGAFRTSAELKDGEIRWIKIESRAGVDAKIDIHNLIKGFSVYESAKCHEYERVGDIIQFHTEKGKAYIIARSPDDYKVYEKRERGGTTWRMAHTNRRVYLGGDIDTAYFNAIDDFTRDKYVGNIRQTNRTLYKFDFGCAREKDYSKYLPHQVNAADPCKMNATPTFFPVLSNAFDPLIGYGFESANALSVIDRNAGDLLRCDFVSGIHENAFLIELPEGEYRLLVISYDAGEESQTIVCSPNGGVFGGKILRKPETQAVCVPFVQTLSGIARIGISTSHKNGWRVNAMILNKA